MKKNNSSDLSPLDFFYWSRLKSEIRSLPKEAQPKDLISLRSALKVAASNIPPADIKKACLSFEKRLQACIDAEGYPFEQKMGKK